MLLQKFVSTYSTFVNVTFNNLTTVSSNSRTLIVCRAYNQTMKQSNLLKPPDHVAGQTSLNKTSFEKPITIPCLVVRGVKVSKVMPIVKRYLLKMRHLKPVKTISDKETEIYLNPELIGSWNDLSEDEQKSLKELSIDDNSIGSRSHTLLYENFSSEAILQAVLPKDVEGLSSFTKIGHIVQVNLREHLLPYKDVIGQVLHDKVSGCRTVVNKVSEIDNTYRNFQMEILQGDDDMHTQVKENKCTFEFDFSKVYWNSRLCTEHERIVNMLKSGDVLFDVFAGVGPFSIPAAKKKCHVYANDLNPESYKWLNHNSTLNKIDKNCLKTFNKDGREFIMEEIKELLVKYVNKYRIFIIMNLPAMAMEFLNAFVGLYKDQDLTEMQTAPTVIVYCFAKGEDYVNIAKNMLSKSIRRDIDDKIVEIFRVRTVSSLKEMMRITFRLDEDILIDSASKNSAPLKQKRTRERDDSDAIMKKCKHGEKQENNEQHLQGCGSQKFETQSQSENRQNQTQTN